MNIRTFVAYLSRNPQYDFPKMRGGGVKGCLELFQSFIRFGVRTRPLQPQDHPVKPKNIQKPFLLSDLYTVQASRYAYP